MPLSRISRSPSVPLRVETLEDRWVPSAAGFVNGVYANFLHRAPAAAELSGWVANLDAGMSPGAVALAVVTSPEYQGRVVQGDYAQLLGRPAGAAEVAGWQGQFQAGMSGFQVEAAILGSDEFFHGHGAANAPWLGAVYKAVLGRRPAPGELAAWESVLPSGASRQAVALDILNSPEAAGRLVTAAYQALLGRSPDPPGLATWAQDLTGGLTPEAFLADLASSPEYIGRVAQGSLANPNAGAADPSGVTPFPTPYGYLSDGQGFVGWAPGGFINDAGFSASD